MTMVQESSAIMPNQSVLLGKGFQKKEMGKQEFLQLLVAQLKNQDPMQPVQDRDFIVQLAQFNTLEQMERMNQTLDSLSQWMALSQAAGLLGKQVEGESKAGPISGLVTGVSVKDGEAVVEVGSKALPISQIVRLFSAPAQ